MRTNIAHGRNRRAASPNLIIMATQTFTPADRKSIAQGWAGSGLSQAEYSAFHQIAPRTLRQWCQRYAPRGTPPDAVVALLADFIERAQALLTALDGRAPLLAQLPEPVGAGEDSGCLSADLLVREEAPHPLARDDREANLSRASKRWSWDDEPA